MKRERVRVRYTGEVQGVGFRYTTSRIARRFDLTGHVANCPDGSVRLEAEGTREEVQAFLEAVRRSPLGPGIRGETTSWGPAGGRGSGFEIQYW